MNDKDHLIPACHKMMTRVEQTQKVAVTMAGRGLRLRP